jgi:hypothetical protein
MVPLCNWAHQLSVDVLGAADEVVGERRRRSSGSTAAATQSPARKEVGMINVWHG